MTLLVADQFSLGSAAFAAGWTAFRTVNYTLAAQQSVLLVNTFSFYGSGGTATAVEAG
jgi:hypothetical protein